MGLKSTIQGLVNQAITSSLGDLASTITLRQVTTSGYNPTTGVVTRTVKNYDVKAVVTNIQQHDSPDVELVANGRKALVPTQQLEGVNIDALDDLVLVDGAEYQLKSIRMDPAGAVYTLLLAGRQGVKFDGLY